MTLDLPWPPSVNVYWRHNRGRAHISHDGIEHRRRVGLAFFASSFRWQPFNASERLEVRLVVHPPDNRRRDLDNLPKAILDGLQHAGVYADDSQIDSLWVLRGSVDPDKQGRVHATIEAISAR